MRTVLSAATGLALALGPCVAADDDAYTTKAMMNNCQTLLRVRSTKPPYQWPQVAEATVCAGYMSGFVAGYYQGAHGNRDPNRMICFPTKFDIDQLATIYVQWARSNANLWHMNLWDTTFMAYVLAFPCPQFENINKQ